MPLFTKVEGVWFGLTSVKGSQRDIRELKLSKILDSKGTPVNDKNEVNTFISPGWSYFDLNNMFVYQNKTNRNHFKPIDISIKYRVYLISYGQ